MELPIYLSLKDAVKASSLGKTYIYELIAANKIVSYVVGKRRLIDAASLIAFIQSQRCNVGNAVPPADAFNSTNLVPANNKE